MKHFLRILFIIGIFLLTFIAAVIGALTIVMKGPSTKAAEIMTMSLRETSALYWIPNLYFSKERIQEIVDSNTVKEISEATDTSLVDITGGVSSENADIEIFEISGSTYIGDVMLIKDPSRVFIGNKGPMTEVQGIRSIISQNVMEQSPGSMAEASMIQTEKETAELRTALLSRKENSYTEIRIRPIPQSDLLPKIKWFSETLPDRKRLIWDSETVSASRLPMRRF